MKYLEVEVPKREETPQWIKVRRWFREFDMFRKIPQDVRARTLGTNIAFLNVFAWAVVVILIVQAFYEMRNPKLVRAFGVDLSENRQANEMRVFVNMTFHSVPCVALSLDFQNSMGGRTVDVESNVYKSRLLPNGTKIGFVKKNKPKKAWDLMGVTDGPKLRQRAANDTDTSCGSCYGEAAAGECWRNVTNGKPEFKSAEFGLAGVSGIVCKDDFHSNISTHTRRSDANCKPVSFKMRGI